MSGSNYCFLTCIQVSQEVGKVVWYSHLLKNIPQFVVIHTVKGFSIVNEAEVDISLEFPCFFYDLMDAGDLISASAFSKSSLYIWKFSVHVTLMPSLKDFDHYLASMCNEYNCVVVWIFFDIVGSTIYGIFQARILEWVSTYFFMGSFQPRNQTQVSYTGRRIIYHWATREVIYYI